MLLPELHLEGARRALDELATGLSDRLTEIASGVAAGRHEQGPAWLTAAREFDGPLPDARVALEQSTEASRWNVRARPYRAELATLTSRPAILDQVAVQLRGIARTLADHPEASALWANPDLAARLAAVACAVRGMPPEAEAAGELTASRGVPRPKDAGAVASVDAPVDATQTPTAAEPRARAAILVDVDRILAETGRSADLPGLVGLEPARSARGAGLNRER